MSIDIKQQIAECKIKLEQLEDVKKIAINDYLNQHKEYTKLTKQQDALEQLAREGTAIAGKDGYADMKSKFVEILTNGMNENGYFNLGNGVIFNLKELLTNEIDVAFILKHMGFSIVTKMYNSENQSKSSARNITKRFYQKMSKKDIIDILSLYK